MMSILRLNSGYMVKYTPLPSGVSFGFHPSGKGVYFIIYPGSCQHTDKVNVKIKLNYALTKNKMFDNLLWKLLSPHKSCSISSVDEENHGKAVYLVFQSRQERPPACNQLTGPKLDVGDFGEWKREI